MILIRLLVVLLSLAGFDTFADSSFEDVSRSVFELSVQEDGLA